MNPRTPRLAGRPMLFGIGAALALTAFLAARPAQAYEHRKSTPSFGAQFGYGRIVLGENYFVQDYPENENHLVDTVFDLAETHTRWGPSAHVTVRFVLDRSHAIGFGFDDLRYRRRGGFNDAQKEAIPRWVKFTAVHADYYIYLRRRMKTSGYLAPFVGIQQRELRFKGSEVQSEEYKLLYGGSFGVEYFVQRTFSIDLSGRVMALRGGNGTNLLLQPALGFHFYVI